MKIKVAGIQFKSETSKYYLSPNMETCDRFGPDCIWSKAVARDFLRRPGLDRRYRLLDVTIDVRLAK